MGLRENMCAGAEVLRVFLGLTLLTIPVLSQSLPPQTGCAGPARADVVQPQYLDLMGTNATDDIGRSIVRSLLNNIQPNPFPGELIQEVIQVTASTTGDDFSKFNDEIGAHFRGFWVTGIIFLVYIVMMPAVGLIFACCRCCGNCGGKMHQRQTESTHCRRRTFYWSTFITAIIICAGNICMFISNQTSKQGLDLAPMRFNNTLNNLLTFTQALPQQVFHVVNESDSTIEAVTRNFDDIGSQLGSEIQKEFRRYLSPMLQPLSLLNRETTNISFHLDQLNSSLMELQSNMDSLQNNVTGVKNRVLRTLSNPACAPCVVLKPQLEPELENLDLDSSVHIPSLKDFREAVDDVIAVNLTSRMEEVENYFRRIPQTVTDDTRQLVQESKQVLDEIRSEIADIGRKMNQIDELQNLSGFISSEVSPYVETFIPLYKTIRNVWWNCGIILSVVVLLVVICYFVGLLLGPVGLKPKVDPTQRSKTSDCGGTFLMMSSGFSFALSWILMIVVLVLFLIGGNLYTLVCRPLRSGELLEVVDSLDYVTNMVQSVGLKGNISIKGVYRDCQENKPVWTTLHLSEKINLEEILNVSQYAAHAQQQFDQMNITLSSVDPLSPDIEAKLRDFSTSAGNFNSSIDSVSSINLNTTAERLEDAASKTSGATQEELRNEASDLRKIQARIDSTINPQVENLNASITRLQSKAENITATVGEVLRNVDAARDFLQRNTTEIVRRESRRFLDCQIRHFDDYKSWAVLMITEQVGRCQPVAEILDFVDVVFCSLLVESLNVFWFSLLWCLAFFIPGIIFAIKLAKYYRRMKYSDQRLPAPGTELKFSGNT